MQSLGFGKACYIHADITWTTVSQWPNHGHCCGDGGGVLTPLVLTWCQSSCSQPHATTHKQLTVLSVLPHGGETGWVSHPNTEQLIWYTQETRAAPAPQLILMVKTSWWNSLLWESLEAATASVILTAATTVEISVHPRSGPRLILCHTDAWSVPVIVLKLNNCCKSLTSVFLPLLKWYSSNMWISIIFDTKIQWPLVKILRLLDEKSNLKDPSQRKASLPPMKRPLSVFTGMGDEEDPKGKPSSMKGVLRIFLWSKKYFVHLE